MIVFPLAPFLGLGCYNSAAVASPFWSQQGEQRGRSVPVLILWTEKSCSPFADCFLIVFHCGIVQFNSECPRDRVYYSFRKSYQADISKSNQSTLSYLLFSHSSNFLNLFVIVINFSPYCAHVCLVVRN